MSSICSLSLGSHSVYLLSLSAPDSADTSMSLTGPPPRPPPEMHTVTVTPRAEVSPAGSSLLVCVSWRMPASLITLSKPDPTGTQKKSLSHCPCCLLSSWAAKGDVQKALHHVAGPTLLPRASLFSLPSALTSSYWRFLASNCQTSKLISLGFWVAVLTALIRFTPWPSVLVPSAALL